MDAQKKRDTRVKGAILAAIAALAAAMFAFPDVFTYVEPDYSISKGFSGLELLFALLGGSMTREIALGKMKPFTLTLPALPVTLAAVALAGAALLLVAVLIVYFGKKRDTRYLAFGFFALAAFVFVSYITLIVSPNMLSLSRGGKTEPFYQGYDVSLFMPLSCLLLLFGGMIAWQLRVERVKTVKRFWFAYLLLILPTACMIVFSFYPIFLQCVIAFKDFKLSNGIWGSEWVGLQYFRQIFSDSEIQRVIFTSIKLSLFRMTVSIIPPLALAVFMFDMGLNRYRKVVQTIVYIPHFFSWVIIYGVFYALLSNTGIINQFIKWYVGDGNYYVDFLTNKNMIIPLLLISQVWKEIGWGTILYLAALSNVDATLYEAAALDGAGPIQRLFHITLPSIMSVIVFLTLMQIGSILSNGLDQILLFANLAVRDQVNTIELWVYQNGIGKLNYGLASAVGFFQSLIGLVLVLGCNKLSTKAVGRGLF